MKKKTRNNLRNRRAVSEIVGSLLILGLVTSVGTVLLFNGMNHINAFSNELSFHDKANNEKFRESLVFEHIRFEPTSNKISIYVGNTGTVDSTISGITIVKMDSQDILVNRESRNDPVLIEESSDPPIDVFADILPSNWDDPDYRFAQYKITIITSKNNFYSTIATPFNT